MLTGVVVFIYPGDAAQIAVTIVIAFVFFGVLEAMSPYESRSDMWMSRVGHFVLFFSFFAALLYKVDVSDEREASQRAFAGTLVAVHVCLIIAVVVNGVATWCASKREHIKIRPQARASIVRRSLRQTTESPVVLLDEEAADTACEAEAVGTNQLV